MERKNNRGKAPEPGMRKYKKIGGGVHTLKDGSLISKGEEFYAHPETIPTAFADIIIAVGEVIPKEEKEALKDVLSYTLKSAGTGWFDIISSETGKPVNDKRLRKKEAEEVLRGLN